MRILASGLAAAAAATTFAAAALTSVTAGALGAGSATVGQCDSNGFGATYVLSGLAATAVTVTGIADPACEGGILRVRVTDAAGESIAAGGPRTIAIDAGTADNTETVAITPQPAAATARRILIVVEGP